MHKIRKPTGKTYEIDSFEKLCNVINSDNYEAITMDLLLWLGFQVKVFDDFRKKHPKESKGKTNYEICPTYFIWIDDDKREVSSVRVKNMDTGEVTTVKLKR